MKTFLMFLAAVILPEVVGAVSGFATVSGVRTWYVTLVKPPFNPPSWVFGPVWTLLYFAMGWASWLVWRQGWERPEVKAALAIYLAQLVVNGLWSILFFGVRSPGLALVDILLLLALIIWTTWRFFALSTTAGALMVPYILWVAFATLLNGSIWWLNRG